jgi:hypothetical protein
METCNALFLKSNVEPILHIFDLEECLKKVRTLVVGIDYKGFPFHFKVPKHLVCMKFAAIKMFWYNIWQTLGYFPNHLFLALHVINILSQMVLLLQRLPKNGQKGM